MKNGSARPLPSEETSIPDKFIVQAFARLDGLALGVSLGAVSGLLLLATTLILLVKGGDPVGPHLELLGQFLIGYEVSLIGSFIGFGYGTVIGFVLGWVTASLHNLFVALYVYLIKFKAYLSSVTDIIDPP